MSKFEILQKRMLELSESQNWPTAKLEWHFTSVHYNDEFQTCLCSHYPIKEICVMENIKTDLECEIGNCCVKKFLGQNMNHFFVTIKKIQRQPDASMPLKTLNYAYKKGVVNHWEYDFYYDTRLKRSLSEKQSAIFTRINQKVLKAILKSTQPVQ